MTANRYFHKDAKKQVSRPQLAPPPPPPHPKVFLISIMLLSSFLLRNGLSPLEPKPFSGLNCCLLTANQALSTRLKEGRGSGVSSRGAGLGAGRSGHLPGKEPLQILTWGGVRMRMAGRGENMLPSTEGAAQTVLLSILASASRCC